MQNNTVQFNLILPTSQLPPALSNSTSSSIAQFIVGYRNVLTVTSVGVEWGLIQSKIHCAKVFCFALSEAQALSIQQIKKQDQFIEVTGSNYILLKIQKNIVRPQSLLENDVVENLLQKIGGFNKINVNVLKNAFQSIEGFRKIINENVNKRIAAECVIKQHSMTERVQLQFHAKKLSGKALLQVPFTSKQTGNMHPENTVPLKLIQN